MTFLVLLTFVFVALLVLLIVCSVHPFIQRLLFCSFEHFYACALVIICSISQISCFWECCVSRTDCGRLAVDMRTGMCAFVYIWASNSSKWHRNSYALFIDWRWFYSFSSFLTYLLAYLLTYSPVSNKFGRTMNISNNWMLWAFVIHTECHRELFKSQINLVFCDSWWKRWCSYCVCSTHTQPRTKLHANDDNNDIVLQIPFFGIFFSVSECPHRTHTTHTIFHTFEIIYTINWKQRQLMEVLGSPRYKHTLTLAGTLLSNEHFYLFTATLSFHLENLSLFLSLSLSLCLSLAVCTSPSVLVYKRNKSLCLCYAYDILIIT